MKIRHVIASVLLGALVPLFAAEMPKTYVLASRENAVYKSGEEIEFKVTADQNADLQYSVNTGKQDSPRRELKGHRFSAFPRRKAGPEPPVKRMRAHV